MPSTPIGRPRRGTNVQQGRRCVRGRVPIHARADRSIRPGGSTPGELRAQACARTEALPLHYFYHDAPCQWRPDAVHSFPGTSCIFLTRCILPHAVRQGLPSSYMIMSTVPNRTRVIPDPPPGSRVTHPAAITPHKPTARLHKTVRSCEKLYAPRRRHHGPRELASSAGGAKFLCA